MPVAVEAPRESPILPHKRWTRDECVVLERSGLVDLDRFELIEGELIQKMPKNTPHMLAVLLLASWLRKVFGELFVVQEGTVDLRREDLPTSAPEPDVMVLTRSLTEFVDRPRSHELQLVAEVSSSTLAFDLITKAPLYARSGIPEYWVLDLESRRLVVHRAPLEGRYCSVYAYREGEHIATLAAPFAELRVGDLLK